MKSIRAKLTKTTRTPTRDIQGVYNNDSAIPRRSKIKLHRQNQSSVMLGAPDPLGEPGAEPSSASPGPQSKKQDSIRMDIIGTGAAEQEYEIVMVPIGMYSFREERRPIRANKKGVVQDGAKIKSRFAVFSGRKSQKRNSMPTLSTNTGSTTATDEIYGLRANGMLSMGSKPSLLVKPTAGVSDQSRILYQEAVAAQEHRAANDGVLRKSANNKGKTPAIASESLADLDRQQMQGSLEISSLLERKTSFSPANSGMCLEEDDNRTWHTAQSRASTSGYADGNRPVIQLEDNGNGMAKVLALEAALQAEMNQRRQEWEEKLEAIALQKEREFERLRIEQLDHQHALEMQREEEARLAAEEAEQNRPLECVCCGDAKPPLEYPAKVATSSCDHDSRTCIECMHNWMAAEFETKGIAELKCPECPCKLTYDDLRTCSGEETFESYENMLTRNVLSQLDEFAWCLSSTCDSGQLNIENESGALMDCASCGYKQCLTHQVAWHAGETCEQYEYRTSGAKAREEERATQAMLDQVSKKCPGPNCGWRIQKTDGCDHIKCKMCKFEFCWECSASHKEIKSIGNTAHQAWCKFHSHNLAVAWPFNAHA